MAKKSNSSFIKYKIGDGTVETDNKELLLGIVEAKYGRKSEQFTKLQKELASEKVKAKEIVEEDIVPNVIT